MAALKTTASRIPYALISSYVLDWIVIIVFVGIGTYLGEVAPNKRPFSLHDPNISYVAAASLALPLKTRNMTQLTVCLL